MANYYPDDGGTYEFIDHFLDQTTAVNTNTTVSVSIDGGPLIPMAYQGIKNEMVSDDSDARDWYTWQVTIPAITAPGRHTFQFFSHYYVWQDADQYWAEFDAYSYCSFLHHQLSFANSLAVTATNNDKPNLYLYSFHSLADSCYFSCCHICSAKPKSGINRKLPTVWGLEGG